MISIQKAQTASFMMLITAAACAVVAGVSFLLAENYDWTYGFLLAAFLIVLLSFGAAKRPAVTAAILIAFAVRLAMFLYCTITNDADADYYAVYAARYAAMPLKDAIVNMPKSAYWYSWIVSFLFRIFGECFTPVRAMNLALSMCCVYITVDLAEMLYQDTQITRCAAMWMALFPNLIRFSSYFANREPMLMLFMLLYLKYSYRYYVDSTFRSLFLSVFFLIPAMILHTSMVAMMALTILIIMTRKSGTTHKVVNVLAKGILAAGMIAAFVYMLVNGIGTEKFGVSGGVELSISGISRVGNLSASGRAAYLQGVTFTSPWLTLLFLPVRVIYFLYTPFAWMVSEAVDVLGLLDAVLYMFLTIYVFRKQRQLKRQPQKSQAERFIVLLLILLLAVTVMFAAVTSNYGTAIRHRCKLFPIILLIIADELRKSRIQIGTRK